MITWRGFGHLALTALIYLALAYSGFKPLALLLPLLIILPLLSAMQLIITARYLKISQSLEPSITERGGKVRLTVNLSQFGWFSHGEIDLVTVRPGSGTRRIYERRIMSLLSGTSREFSLDMECSHRGNFKAGVSSVRSRDILGLFFLPVNSRRLCGKMLSDLIVLPRSSPSAYFDDLTSFLYDWQHKQTPDAGDEVDAVANIRTHRPGDSMKRTHWKLTARMNEIMIKEFENPIRQAGLILIDMARPAQDSYRRSACLDLADACTDRVAYLTSLLLKDGNCLRLVNYQQDGRHELSVGHPAELRQAQLMLAAMDWSDGWPAEQALIEETSPDKGLCFIILLATRLNKATVSQLLDLRQRGRPVWLVLLAGANGQHPEQVEAVRLYLASGLPMTMLDSPDEREEEAAE